MRTVIFILIIAILVVIGAIATGFLNINQVRGVQAPQVSTNGKAVTARGGQAPAFDIQTGSLKVGSTQTSVKVPTVTVQKPADTTANTTTGNAM